MQPANELEDLRSKAFSSWPEKGDEFFRTRMIQFVAVVFSALIAWIAVSSDVGVEKVGVAYAVLITAFITLVFVFRLWVDWNYVGDRLRDNKVLGPRPACLPPCAPGPAMGEY